MIVVYVEVSIEVKGDVAGSVVLRVLDTVVMIVDRDVVLRSVVVRGEIVSVEVAVLVEVEVEVDVDVLVLDE